MARGARINEGLGAFVDMDELSSGGNTYKRQRVAIAIGALNTDDGNVSSVNPLPVTSTSTRPATSTQTTPEMSTSSAVVLASNANRLGATIFNPLDSDLFVVFDNAVATSATASRRIPPGGSADVPFGYTGEIRGILAASGTTGNISVQEFTA